ncbi:Glycosyltransferase 1 domain-containing protein 1 [Bienertia sinuspersici]
MPEFHQTVQQVWNQEIRGCAMFQIMEKLKGLKGKLKGLHAVDIQATVKSAREYLEDCQTQLHKNPHNTELAHKEYQANQQMREVNSQYYSWLQQKAKIHWLQVGDSNSNVFYNSLKVRTSRNTINRLMDSQGRWVEDMESITEAFTSFYNTLLQGTDRTKVYWDKVVWGNAAVPKHQFITWLGIRQRLLNRDRMVRMGLSAEDKCCLCSRGVDSHSHLFFECDFSRNCWKQTLDWLKVQIHHFQMQHIVQWLARNCKGDRVRRQACCTAVNALVYSI